VRVSGRGSVGNWRVEGGTSMSRLASHRGLVPVQGKFSNIFCAHCAFWGKRLNHVFIRASGERRSISSDILASSLSSSRPVGARH